MYLGTWQVDDLLTFACNTHTPATGAATDADAPPTYRVYEDETGTAILTGSMALLDDANTVGQYSEQITLSAANGFEVGKTYTIRIAATVGGIAGAQVDTFQVELAPATAANLATANSGITTLLNNLTLAATDITTILGRVTGTVATAAKMLSLFQSALRNDVTVDADIGGTYDDATDSLQAIRDRGDAAWTTGSSSAGSGAITYTYTVTNSDDGLPIAGVAVWVTTDLAGTNTVAGTLVTDAFGAVVFYLDAGTYYFWRQLAGWTFANPDTEVVS